nr:hypothetical protein Iba_scaffold17804CG0180 [Ipomoea batatas]
MCAAGSRLVPEHGGAASPLPADLLKKEEEEEEEDNDNRRREERILLSNWQVSMMSTTPIVQAYEQPLRVHPLAPPPPPSTLSSQNFPGDETSNPIPDSDGHIPPQYFISPITIK